MAADDGAETGCSRVQIELIEIVLDVQQDVSNLDYLCFIYFPCPLASVHVSPYGDDGSDCA